MTSLGCISWADKRFGLGGIGVYHDDPCRAVFVNILSFRRVYGRQNSYSAVVFLLSLFFSGFGMIMITPFRASVEIYLHNNIKLNKCIICVMIAFPPYIKCSFDIMSIPDAVFFFNDFIAFDIF